MKPFKSIKQARISEEVVNQLKGAILSGDYKPGEKIPSERELTDQFQVSRVVIREAIRELELTGFVRIQQGPAGGAHVMDLSFDHLSNAFKDLFLANKLSAAEVIQTRLHTDPEIARLAALNRNEKSIQPLNRALEAELEKEPNHDKRVTRRFEVDYQLAQMCGNRLYQAISKALLDLTREIVLTVKPDSTVIFNHEEHVDIVRAVSAGNAEAAADAVRKHVHTIGDGLIKLEKTYRKQRGLAP
jgi:GntR family transcriptional regulator, transcriptional repressor for pyruvate dehydrogenase complex